MDNEAIYVVFTATPYRIGGLIRSVTRAPYNHVSIAMDEDLTKMYSFARRYFRTPFYGGFVKESVSRYNVKGSRSQVRLCRIPVTKQQYAMLEQKMGAMMEQSDYYLYNHLSAITSLFHRTVNVKDAYICADFCTQILQSIGIDIEPHKYHSVQDLEHLLKDYTIYVGSMPDAEIYDAEYYAKKPVPHPFLCTAKSFFELFRRLGQ